MFSLHFHMFAASRPLVKWGTIRDYRLFSFGRSDSSYWKYGLLDYGGLYYMTTWFYWTRMLWGVVYNPTKNQADPSFSLQEWPNFGVVGVQHVENLWETCYMPQSIKQVTGEIGKMHALGEKHSNIEAQYLAFWASEAEFPIFTRSKFQAKRTAHVGDFIDNLILDLSQSIRTFPVLVHQPI